MNYLEMFKSYQKEFIKSDKNYVIGNFTRGAGKSTSLIGALAYHKPKNVAFVSGLLENNMMKIIDSIIRNSTNINMDYNISRIVVNEFSSKSYRIFWDNGDITDIYDLNLESSNRGLKILKFDMAIYDECLPTIKEISADKHMSVVTLPIPLNICLPDKIIKKCDLVTCGIKKSLDEGMLTLDKLFQFKQHCSDYFFFKEIDIFDEYKSTVKEEVKEKDNASIIDYNIKKLLVDLSKTPTSKIMTIKDITQTVGMLVKIKKDINSQIV